MARKTPPLLRACAGRRLFARARPRDLPYAAHEYPGFVAGSRGGGPYQLFYGFPSGLFEGAGRRPRNGTPSPRRRRKRKIVGADNRRGRAPSPWVSVSPRGLSSPTRHTRTLFRRTRTRSISPRKYLYCLLSTAPPYLNHSIFSISFIILYCNNYILYLILIVRVYQE